jgi:hypothetical protein
MSATTDYELRFMNTKGVRVFTRVADCESDKDAIAAIQTAGCPLTYSRVEVWRGQTKVHATARLATAR